MNTKTKKNPRLDLSADEKEMAEALNALVRYAGGEKVPGLVVETHPRRVTAKEFKAVRLHVFKKSQSQFASMFDLSKEAIAKYEQGKIPVPAESATGSKRQQPSQKSPCACSKRGRQVNHPNSTKRGYPSFVM